MLLAFFPKNQLNLQEEKVTEGEGDHFVVMDSNLGGPKPSSRAAPERLVLEEHQMIAFHYKLVECVINSMVILLGTKKLL